MPRLKHLPDLKRNEMLSFPVQVNHDTPWTSPTRPLREARVALVTSAGLHRRGDPPFVSNHHEPDYSYRRLPVDTPAADILQSHASAGFDRSAIQRDLNVTYPIDRLRELRDRGVIGSLAESCYSFMGALRKVERLERETAPEVARLLKQDRVDVVLITPT